MRFKLKNHSEFVNLPDTTFETNLTPIPVDVKGNEPDTCSNILKLVSSGKPQRAEHGRIPIGVIGL